LAARGGKIYIACRDKKRGEDALIKIKEKSRSRNVFFLPLDLASLESIREFVEKFLSIEKNLDILVNNAGIYGPEKSFTKDGFEMQMGVNHLGHFYLTHLLLDTLKKSAPSRIVVVSSIAESWGKIERDNFNSEKSYNRHKAYFNSKLANVLYTRELAKRLKGSGVIVNCCHPGAVKTEIQRDGIPIIFYPIAIFVLPFLKTAKQGAQTQITLAIDPDLANVSGKYFDNCKEKKASKRGQDDATAEWLWNKSIEMLKL
jgi:retinol dehydrogenase 13